MLKIRQRSFTYKNAAVQNFLVMGLVLKVASSVVVTDLYVKDGGYATLQCPEKPVDSWQDVRTNTFIATCNNGNIHVNLNTSLGKRVFVTPGCDLNIRYVKVSDHKVFRCFTPNHSHVIEIKFRQRPKIIAQFSTVALKTEKGQPAYISVTVLSYEKPTAAWVQTSGGVCGILIFKNDTKNSTKYMLTSSIIPNEDHHFGNYSIRLRNGKGTSTVNITLEYLNWRVYVEPKDVSCEKASTVNIRCFINKNIFPSYSCNWQQHFNDVFIKSMDCVVQNGSSLLTLKYCDNRDAGRHTCILKSNGVEFSASSMVSIKGPPYVTKTKKLLHEGYIRLIVFYISNPASFEPVWYHRSFSNERPINTSSPDYVVEVSHSNNIVRFYGVEINTKGLKAMLDILDGFNGSYTCHVRNLYGTSEVSFKVTDHDYIVQITPTKRSIETTEDSTDGGFVIDDETINVEYIYGSVGGLVIVLVIVIIIAIICRQAPQKKVTLRIVQQRQRGRGTLPTRVEMLRTRTRPRLEPPRRESTSTTGYDEIPAITPPPQIQSDEGSVTSGDQSEISVTNDTVTESNYDDLDSQAIDKTVHEYGSCQQEKEDDIAKVDNELYIVPGPAYMVLTAGKGNDIDSQEQAT